MAGEGRIAISEEDLKAEVQGLRRSLLPILWPATLALGWGWFTYVLTRSWSLEMLGINTAAALGLALVSYLVSKVYEKHYRLACWALSLGLMSFVILLAGVHPASSIMAFGVLVIIVSEALLGTLEATLLMLLTWGAASAARSFGLSGGFIGWASTLDMLLLYILTLGATWLAGRPLRTALEWMLSSWHQARRALSEVQQRRGELYRVVRALEEATYRMERMNNELLIAQREAEEARALKARFAAMVSHEIRSPLNLILGFSRMMALFPERYEEPLPKCYHEDVDTIYRNSQHLLALLDDILDLSQIEAQRLPLVKDRIDLEEEVVKKTVTIVQPLAARKGLALREELAGNLPTIVADPVRLRQALLNLLTNAVRFTERGGITVRTALQDGKLLVSVQDTGPGIDAKDLPKLFKEFSQVHLTQTREQGGSGLGLSISKHLVELHGGEIWAESKVGVGTTVSFTIPLSGSEPTGADFVKTEDARRTFSPTKTCLVVHSSLDVAKVLGRYIEGYRVMGIAQVNEVSAVVEQIRPRAVIASHDAAESVAEQLAKVPYEVPLISCGLPSPEDQGPLRGLLSYITKPILPEMVMTIMNKVAKEGETTVLLVDDDPDAVRLLETMLTALPHPYRILKAYDGFQALELMETVVPDVVFLDLLMPGLDGEQTMARMRADERLRKVPVVVVSGQDWAAGQIKLRMPLIVRCSRPLDMDQGARCLQALLDVFSARYLPEPEFAPPSG